MKRLLFDALVVILLFISITVSAKTINLYSEPKNDSKVTGNVNTETGITIIYSPKTGEWVKVGNPSNGDVGWIKSSDLDMNGYNMRIFTSGNGAHNYSVYQFTTDKNQLDQKQLEKEMQHLMQQHQMMQIYMTQIFNDMFSFPQPIFLPVLVKEQPMLQKLTSDKTSHMKNESQITPVNKK